MTKGTILFFATSIFLMSCKKNNTDTTPPVITLQGANPISISLNSATYVEPGYTATDAADGNITNLVTINTIGINYNLKGNYKIIYSVTDNAGNTATAARGANVVNDADFLSGDYNARDSSADNGTVASFTSTFTSSTTLNNNFTINNFGNFGTVINVSCVYQSLGAIIDLIGSPSLGTGNTLGASSGNITSLSSPVNIVIDYYYTSGANIYHHYASYSK